MFPATCMCSPPERRTPRVCAPSQDSNRLVEIVFPDSFQLLKGGGGGVQNHQDFQHRNDDVSFMFREKKKKNKFARRQFNCLHRESKVFPSPWKLATTTTTTTSNSDYGQIRSFESLVKHSAERLVRLRKWSPESVHAPACKQAKRKSNFLHMNSEKSRRPHPCDFNACATWNWSVFLLWSLPTDRRLGTGKTNWKFNWNVIPKKLFNAHPPQPTERAFCKRRFFQPTSSSSRLSEVSVRMHFQLLRISLGLGRLMEG